jgi:ABC-type lipoprotein export system ATPase subunit
LHFFPVSFPEHTMPLLEIRDLIKTYTDPDGNRNRVVDVPHFSLEAGEQVALRGSSGCGKTTLLHLIAGILQADSGAILLDGADMSRLPEAKRDRLRAETIGYVFQTFNLLQGYTALENVLLGMMFGKGVDTARAKAILERVGMSDRMQYQPRQLSVGQQQRVALARALANHPKLVLADEPTGNLDPHHAREALAMIREICRENGAALLLVSHDEGVLAQFERAVDFAEINVCLKGARS